MNLNVYCCPVKFTFITNVRQVLGAVPLHPGSKAEHGRTWAFCIILGYTPRVPVLEDEGVPIGPMGPELAAGGAGLLTEADPSDRGEFLGDAVDVVVAHSHQVSETGLTGSQGFTVSGSQAWNLTEYFSRRTWQFVLASSQVRFTVCRKSSCSAMLQVSIRAEQENKYRRNRSVDTHSKTNIWTRTAELTCMKSSASYWQE